MEFIGRKRELAVLEKFWNKEGYDNGGCIWQEAHRQELSAQTFF